MAIHEEAARRDVDTASVVALLRQRNVKRRRARAALFGALSLVLVLALGPFGKLLVSGDDSGVLVPSGPTSGHNSSSLEKREFKLSQWQSGPSAATPGQAYPFDLNVHCGLKYAVFSQKNWVTSDVLPADWVNKQNGLSVIPGYGTLVDGSKLRFEAPGYLSQPITFQSVSDAVPGCA